MKTVGTFDATALDALIELLRGRGYEVIGSAARDGAIRYEPVASVAESPSSVGDEQSPPRYRLRDRRDAA